ncbi:hypothetical protein M422DRAFT_271295 [Sphaerobolus stellatus SS14]|uniref:Unplaced genomic scaffold SPHSTscaffold_258, whole genome shotgun sequence n=1 Tax=Sphaerobolus stellatus (strain SS14) TaxID=990650 RepID=A0A0C9U0I9_SPHS4|nr:hypothetical protein M422DRAFT_271295 [Sphaerobolus stellatus SS14]
MSEMGGCMQLREWVEDSTEFIYNAMEKLDAVACFPDVEGSINSKVLNPLLAGIDTPLEAAVFSILLCRFML